MMKRLTRVLLIAGGNLCVALAVLGLFLPVLPTTPFLLLAAVCYARSSERFYHWLVTNRWFGAYIRNYREGRGIPLWQSDRHLAVVAHDWLRCVVRGASMVGEGCPAWHCGRRDHSPAEDRDIRAGATESATTQRMWHTRRPCLIAWA